MKLWSHSFDSLGFCLSEGRRIKSFSFRLKHFMTDFLMLLYSIGMEIPATTHTTGF